MQTHQPFSFKKLPPGLSGFLGGLAGAALVLAIVVSQGQGFLGTFLSGPQVTTQPQDVEVVALDVSDIVEKVTPSVVSIVITKDVPVMEQYYDDPFSDFFGGNSPFHFSIPRYRQNGTEEKEIGGGSGFFISDDGYLVTNGHVVEDEEASYTVFTNDGTSYEANVIAIDEVIDIALLKIDATNPPFLTFGDSDTLKLGEAVIAIGNALGEFRNTVSTGVVSGLSRSIIAGTSYASAESLDNVIQTDAAINPGNSGGPLLNLEGQVVGVNVAVAQNSENIAFSLPVNIIQDSIESMKTNGRVIRPYLGVRYVMVDKALMEKNNLTVDYGALVLRGEETTDLPVIPGSPADKAGIEEYDIILEMDGQKIDDEHSLASLIRNKQVGDTIQLKILHDGEEKTLSVLLEESPS